MEVYRHSGHTVYVIKKRLVFIKNHSKVKFWHKGKIMPNFRFIINPHKKWQYFHWFIRLPFFYFNKDNGGWQIGTPNRYLWVIR